MSNDQRCGTCRWARWVWTKHNPPRINPREPGRCQAPVPALVLPLAADVQRITALLQERNRRAIWLGRHEYPGCPAWAGYEPGEPMRGTDEQPIHPRDRSEAGE